jgi:hypothetical protein
MSSEAIPAISEAVAYFAVVGGDHTVRVPETIPSGSKVAIVIVAGDASNAESLTRERKWRFEAIRAAIHAVIERGHDGSEAPSIEEITRLVKKARASRKPALA